MESGIQLKESGILLTNTGIEYLESGIQLKESEIPLVIGTRNPSSTDKYWNPESKTVLDSLTWSDIRFIIKASVV